MESIGKIYQIYDPEDTRRLDGIDYFKKLMKDAGFKCFMQSGGSKIYFHAGNDILDCDRHIVGFMDGGRLYTTDSRLEEFLSKLEW